MKGYLSIGEFAGLRHVNPKSLRYYERIGALVPAYTDPDTGYRYYAPEQVIEMDMILMCLELGIPLREATRYRKSDGTLDIRRLLQEGQQKVQEKLSYLQNSLRQMEDALRRVETAEQVGNREGTYRRTLPQRMILREPFVCDGGKLSFKQASARIFQKGQSMGLLPVFTFPIGLMATRTGETFVTDIFLEVLPQPEKNSSLDVLPGGVYLCGQRSGQALENPGQMIESYFAQHAEAQQLIITNLSSANFAPNDTVLELQQPCKT